MHVGVAGCRPNISIETKAKNGPYDKLDVLKKKRPQGPFVDGQKEIKTSLDYEKCIEIAQNSRLETSDDAGLYLCEYIYYSSLRKSLEMKATCVFVHGTAQILL
ncbi:Oidioi.mRNA.OKI2018_I69.PAR.g11222.t1.cds [Oikopleura dioica]|uniref:Oidioi.mRNA.OKI2018_I69.PAR.g11222.t1.cds n=1 Tax=Oikopleura dioica TaxID=34765 RepID=A0ABN7RZ17_OIKDI|nr:Oidioi.mRNA.OKI2018_I69.PAR.g11222.t1.cds [Oikopleura dioica]